MGARDEWALGQVPNLTVGSKAQFPRVINLSLRQPDQTGPDRAGDWTALGRLASRTDGTAPIVVAAAGNDGWSRPFLSRL